MRTLIQALSDHELSALRVLGEWWEMDLSGASKQACVKQLAEALEGLDMDDEFKFLPVEEASVIRDLVQAGGKLPVAIFERKHGEVRQMGPAALEREEPWFDPISPAEALWYRGFLFRAFDETADGLGEFYFLPRALWPDLEDETASDPAESAGQETISPAEAPAASTTAPTDAVDDLVTLLSMAQNDLLEMAEWDKIAPYLYNPDPIRGGFLMSLAVEMSIMRQAGEAFKPAREAVTWLRQVRESQLRSLAESWSNCQWNALHHTPGLSCEGSGWQNDPILPRTALLDSLPQSRQWFHISDVVAAVKSQNPDFQRPDGNYDTWYIRDDASGEFLRGFEAWDQVEGRLLTYILQGPLHWLGMVDLGEGGVYRVTESLVDWLADEPVPAKEVQIPPVLQPDGIFLTPFNASRFHRFQISRVAELLPLNRDQPLEPFRYQISITSLHRARAQGILPDRVVEFLQGVSEKPLPPGLKRAIERWGAEGTEARVEQVAVLRVNNPEILDVLRQNARTSPYLGETLGDLAVVVLDWEQLRQAAIQLGLMLDIRG